MRLFQSHDLNHRFKRLVWVDSSYFFNLLYMRSSQSHDLSYEFSRLTRVDSNCFFMSFFFIDFFSLIPSFNIEFIGN
jgi:hypothetical protein